MYHSGTHPQYPSSSPPVPLSRRPPIGPIGRESPPHQTTRGPESGTWRGRRAANRGAPSPSQRALTANPSALQSPVRLGSFCIIEEHLHLPSRRNLLCSIRNCEPNKVLKKGVSSPNTSHNFKKGASTISHLNGAIFRTAFKFFSARSGFLSFRRALLLRMESNLNVAVLRWIGGVTGRVSVGAAAMVAEAETAPAATGPSEAGWRRRRR